MIGINSAIASVAQNTVGGQDGQSGNIGIGFAIPANTAVDIAKQLIADGTAEHGYLGAGVTASDTGTGAVLQRLSAGGPADAAGLRAGDVVTSIDSRLVEGPADLVAGRTLTRPGRHDHADLHPRRQLRPGHRHPRHRTGLHRLTRLRSLG